MAGRRAARVGATVLGVLAAVALLAAGAVGLVATGAATSAPETVHPGAASAARPAEPAGGPPHAAPPARTRSTSSPARLRVLGITPANGASRVGGTARVTVRLSGKTARSTPLPTVTPSVPGSWRGAGTATLTFTPSEPFVPLSSVTVRVPGGVRGVRSAGGSPLGAAVSSTYTVENGSVLRIQQLLALLDYSPLAFSAAPGSPAATDTAGQLAAAYAPPGGRFAWRTRSWPPSLLALWRPGIYSVMTRGLVMSFQADHGLDVNGQITAGLWNDMLDALATGVVNTGGYNFALADKTPPETLTVWHDGTVVLRSRANTGISQSPTADGVFPVFARYRNQVMKGTNPDGTKYADPVQFVAYFNGGDAVHYLARADYGIPQSLGCVELPLAAAAKAWPYLAYGTLVDVIG